MTDTTSPVVWQYVDSKHAAEPTAKAWGYPEYAAARARLEWEARLASRTGSAEDVANKKATLAQDAKLGFPSWQPLGGEKGKYYISSIDRWHADVLTKELCTRAYEAMNKPVMILGLVEKYEDEEGAEEESSGKTEGDDESETKTNASATEDKKKKPSPGNPENAKYPAHFWNMDYLAKSKFAECMFRLGDDDDGNVLRTKLKVFLQYVKTNKDDSPLYLFEDNVQRCPVSRTILSLYKVPSYFSQDLLIACMPESRLPPYNWVLMGAKRSGTRMHLDPRSTSAWNMSVTGRKRWVLMRPGIPTNVSKGHIVMTDEEADERSVRGNPQAIYFFTSVLPRLRRWIHGREKKREQRLRAIEAARAKGDTGTVEEILARAAKEQEAIEGKTGPAPSATFSSSSAGEASFWPEVTADAAFGSNVEEEKRGDGTWRRKRWNELEDGYGLMEFIQYPGETILVPSGWWHAVINVDDTVAYTQNFTNKENFIPVWRHMRRFNKGMSRRWLRNLDRVRPDIAEMARDLDKKDNFVLSPFRAHPNADTKDHGAETSDEDLTTSDESEVDSPFEETDVEE